MAGLGGGWGLAGARGWAGAGLGGLGGHGTRSFALEFGLCDWNLVLGWVGLEIDGLGGSTPAMTSNFSLFLS